jgi:hypothetical protein
VLVGTDVAELCVFKAYFQRFDYLTLLIWINNYVHLDHLNVIYSRHSSFIHIVHVVILYDDFRAWKSVSVCKDEAFLIYISSKGIGYVTLGSSNNIANVLWLVLI